MRVAILIPVLARPQRVEPLLTSIRSTVGGGVEPLFLCSPGDSAEIGAIERCGARHEVMGWKAGRGDYARKMNRGIAVAAAEGFTHVFLGADDLNFKTDWLKQAVATQKDTDACVIGTNDLGNPRVKIGRHSTHSLIDLDYRHMGSLDGGALLHEGYWHNFVDDELIQTAVYRGTFAASRASIVEHLHPDWQKAERDSTYAKGKQNWGLDRALYDRRCVMWGERR
jgi:hypothetical protein